jgi:hypothetical protein
VLGLRSCKGCSFRKTLKNDDFCTQVQPPSKILNPYDAQLCIFYTPEQATTTSTVTELIKIKDAPFYRENVIANYSFETGDLTGWTIRSGTPTVQSDGGSLSHCGFYVLALRTVGGITDMVGQALSRPVPSNSVINMYVMAKAASGNPYLYVKLYYTDGSVSSHGNYISSAAYASYPITPDANKIIGGLAMYTYSAITIYIDEISLIANQYVSLTTALPAGTNNIGDVDVLTLPSTSINAPAIFNVTMTNANTEYLQAIGTAKKFLIHTRDESIFRLAFVTGKVAAPTEPYFTILANEAYYEDNINQSLTLYFASPSAGKIIEIIVWT